jgi:hypothetical protein
MDDQELQLRIQLRASARLMAATIRGIERVNPGCYGKHGDVIRRCAAGDDVSFEELLTAAEALQLSASS